MKREATSDILIEPDQCQERFDHLRGDEITIKRVDTPVIAVDAQPKHLLPKICWKDEANGISAC